MERVFSDSVAQPRMQLVLLLVIGSVTGLLAVIGMDWSPIQYHGVHARLAST
jgi:hypothetical protein